MLAVGATGSSFYDVQRDFVLTTGESASLGRYTFRYDGFQQVSFADRDEATADFSLLIDGRDAGVMSTQRVYYRDFNMAATRAGIRSNPIEDFYIVPAEFGDDGTAVFRVYVNPLVWWMWASGPVLVMGMVLAVSPRRKAVRIRVPQSRQLVRA
jgi:cytochrome c-type biogenesis protein CcmF